MYQQGRLGEEEGEKEREEEKGEGKEVRSKCSNEAKILSDMAWCSYATKFNFKYSGQIWPILSGLLTNSVI